MTRFGSKDRCTEFPVHHSVQPDRFFLQYPGSGEDAQVRRSGAYRYGRRRCRGGFLGRTLNKKMTATQVDTLFRWMLVLIVAISCYNLYRYRSML